MMRITHRWIITPLPFPSSNTMLFLFTAILLQLTTCDPVSSSDQGVKNGVHQLLPHEIFQRGTFLRIVMLHVS